jgi:hypothetical protein
MGKVSTQDEMQERVRELSMRRLEAFNKGGLDAIPESTKPEDIDMLQEARESLDDYSRHVLDLYSDVWREWGKYRCAVCGLTVAQAAAIGYDCAMEC